MILSLATVLTSLFLHLFIILRVEFEYVSSVLAVSKPERRQKYQKIKYYKKLKAYSTKIAKRT